MSARDAFGDSDECSDEQISYVEARTKCSYSRDDIRRHKQKKTDVFNALLKQEGFFIHYGYDRFPTVGPAVWNCTLEQDDAETTEEAYVIDGKYESLADFLDDVRALMQRKTGKDFDLTLDNNEQ